MPIIKLSAIDSTNAYLKAKSSKSSLEDFTVVMADHQTNGRGQMGTTWSSEASKNLTISVFKDVSNVNIDQSFYISIVTSLAIVKALQSLSIPKLAIKWPNDIMSENFKICGILIENVIKHDELKESIIGIGLNINQTDFQELPNASSLKEITGMFFNLEEVLELILQNLKQYFSMLDYEEYSKLKTEYESYLFRKNKPSTFKNIEGATFSGFIKSISEQGNLQVLLEDNIVKEFDLKEIALLY